MPILEFNNVWKKFRRGEKVNSLRDAVPNWFRKSLPVKKVGALKRSEFWVLQDVSFQLQRGEIVGIIGANGAGKSTTLKLLSGILSPNQGEIAIRGRLSALIEITAGFHPELTGRENLFLNGTILGMKKREIEKKFDEIVEFSGVGEFIDTPVKRYSSGMYSRLGFSVAAHMDPDILLVDEVLSVGDIAFQAKCAQKMRELFSKGATIILVSHNLALVQSLTKRVILLDKGRISREGTPDEVIPHYENIVHRQREEELKRKINVMDYKVKVRDSSPINILDVHINNGEGLEKDQFNTGEHIIVSLSYEIVSTVESPVFGLDIVRADGVICCSSNTKGDSALIKNYAGKNAVSIDLGRINLAAGIYILKIYIWDKDMLHPFAIRRQDILKINTDNPNKKVSAVFLPEIKWEQKR